MQAETLGASVMDRWVLGGVLSWSELGCGADVG